MASIRKHKGSWQARIKRGTIIAEKSFHIKRDAEHWARQTEAEIQRGEYQPAKAKATEAAPARLNDLLTRYEKEVAPLHRSESTVFNIRTLRRMVGDTILADLNAQVVARWRDSRLKMVKPASVVKELHTLLRIPRPPGH